MVGRGLLQKHLCKTFFLNICSNTEINANFHFSHYKSMKTWSCHSNERTWATTIKNTIYVEANVMNMYAKFQLHPLYGFWGEDFWIFFSKIYPLCCHGNQSNSAIWTNFIWIVENYSWNISVKKNLNKYLQWDIKNCQFPLFPLWVNGNYKLPYQLEFLPIGTKKNTIIRSPHL